MFGPHSIRLIASPIVDGQGGEPYKGNVAIIGDKIAAVGTGLAPGRRDIDATGRYVLPGGIDTHMPRSLLAQLGIALKAGYAAAHLDPAPDLVVVGNAMSRGNAAVEHLLDAVRTALRHAGRRQTGFLECRAPALLVAAREVVAHERDRGRRLRREKIAEGSCGTQPSLGSPLVAGILVTSTHASRASRNSPSSTAASAYEVPVEGTCMMPCAVW